MPVTYRYKPLSKAEYLQIISREVLPTFMYVYQVYAWKSEEDKGFPVIVINGGVNHHRVLGIYPMSSTGEMSAFNHSAISSA